MSKETAFLVSMVVPTVSFLAYCALLMLALRSPRSQVAKIFIAYLLLMLVWSLGSFMMRTGAFPGPLAWNRFMTCGMLGVPFVFFHFSAEILERTRSSFFIRLGYVFYAFFLAGNLCGLIVSNAYLLPAEFVYFLGPLAKVFAFVGGAYILTSALLLAREAFLNPASFWFHHLVYPSVGAVVMLAGCLLNFIPAVGKYPADIATNTVNAFLLAYAIYRFHFLNIAFVIRKGLLYSTLTVLLTTSYFLIVFFLERVVRTEVGYNALLVALPVAAVISLVFDPLKEFLHVRIDRIFLGHQYGYRRTLRDFSRIMTSILDFDQLEQSLLDLVTKALEVRSAVFLLADAEGDFAAHKSVGVSPQVAGAVKLEKESPLVRWLLEREEPVLRWEEARVLPEFQALWQKEKDYLAYLGACVLLGIRMQKQLVGILLLSEKTSGDCYTDEDEELLVTLANEAAVAISNARAYREARLQALHDELTKLYNYRFFHKFLDKEFAHCQRTGQSFSLIFIDLDFFKLYNDTYGHMAGDVALAGVGKVLTECVRVSDVVARYGGDEFVVLLPGTDAAQARVVAERTREAVQYHFLQGEAPGGVITASIGVASYPEHVQSKYQLLSCADRALYQAKRLGGNRVVVYNPRTFGQEEQGFLKKQVEDVYLATIYALAAVVNARDNYTYQHSEMVTSYAVALAEALGLPEEQKEKVRSAAMLHDIGKIGISESILNKKGPLTPLEREIVQRHVSVAEAIVNQVPYLRELAPIILHHHEAYDGTGYPCGLKGEEIPLEARILAIADAYHAMTSDRPYRKAMKPEEAVRQLNLLAGKQFASELVSAFVGLLRRQGVASA